MRIIDIKNLSYNSFRMNRKKIEECINNYFKDKEIDYDAIYENLNFILWGSNDTEILKNQNKYIEVDPYQIFYVNKNEPGFTLEVGGTISIILNDENDPKVSDIKIKIKAR